MLISNSRRANRRPWNAPVALERILWRHSPVTNRQGRELLNTKILFVYKNGFYECAFPFEWNDLLCRNFLLKLSRKCVVWGNVFHGHFCVSRSVCFRFRAALCGFHFLGSFNLSPRDISHSSVFVCGSIINSCHFLSICVCVCVIHIWKRSITKFWLWRGEGLIAQLDSIEWWR